MAHTPNAARDAHVVAVAEEGDGVGGVGGAGAAADSLAGLDVPDDELVVVLATCCSSEGDTRGGETAI